jgi:hypothetical protein
VVVSADHDGADFPFPHHFVKGKSNVPPAFGVLIKDSGLGADDESVFFSVLDPYVIVAILRTAMGVDAGHSGMVGL